MTWIINTVVLMLILLPSNNMYGSSRMLKELEQLHQCTDVVQNRQEFLHFLEWIWIKMLGHETLRVGFFLAFVVLKHMWVNIWKLLTP